MVKGQFSDGRSTRSITSTKIGQRSACSRAGWALAVCLMLVRCTGRFARHRGDRERTAIMADALRRRTSPFYAESRAVVAADLVGR